MRLSKATRDEWIGGVSLEGVGGVLWSQQGPAESWRAWPWALEQGGQ